jgi:ABC-type transport system involved in multi-copper enzyme maturation permease subunit
MRVLAIARNTFREAVRDKVFGLVGAFGLLLVISSIVLSPLTVGAQTKMVADVGLASISIFAMLIILLMGSGLVHKEIDKRTIMTVLSKPITRTDYVLGKYFGLLSTLTVIMAAMSALFLIAVWMTPTVFEMGYLKALYMGLLEMVLVTAVAIFFSSFTSPILTSLFTLGVFLAGHTLTDLRTFAAMAGSTGVIWSMKVLRWVLPDLEIFNVRNAAVHNLPIEPAHIFWASVYALLYSTICLILGSWIFGRREFK